MYCYFCVVNLCAVNLWIAIRNICLLNDFIYFFCSCHFITCCFLSHHFSLLILILFLILLIILGQYKFLFKNYQHAAKNVRFFKCFQNMTIWVSKVAPLATEYCPFSSFSFLPYYTHPHFYLSHFSLIILILILILLISPLSYSSSFSPFSFLPYYTYPHSYLSHFPLIILILILILLIPPLLYLSFFSLYHFPLIMLILILYIYPLSYSS